MKRVAYFIGVALQPHRRWDSTGELAGTLLFKCQYVTDVPILTNYDDLLLKGIERREAREKVYQKVFQVLDRWKHGGSQD